MDVQRVQQQQQKQITGVLVFHFPFISVHRPCAARMSPSEAALIERKNFPFFSVFVVGCAGQSNLENGGDGAKATTREETKREKKGAVFDIENVAEKMEEPTERDGDAHVELEAIRLLPSKTKTIASPQRRRCEYDFHHQSRRNAKEEKKGKQWIQTLQSQVPRIKQRFNQTSRERTIH